MSAPLITSHQLAYARQTAERSMADTCNVIEDQRVPNGKGGFTLTPQIETTVPCGIQAVQGGAEQVIADRLGWTVAYVIRVPYDTAITPANRLTVGARTFQIGAILDGGATATVKRAVCKEAG